MPVGDHVAVNPDLFDSTLPLDGPIRGIVVRNNQAADIMLRNGQVEGKFHKEKFRVVSEMRILAKIRLKILDFVGYVEI